MSISNVHGFTKGLKHNQLRRIERLATRRVAPEQIVSPELARQMTEISHETGRQIGVLLNRKGQVEYVMVGNAKQIEMPDFGRARVSADRFRGLRCVHTHLNGEKLTPDDLTDLALLRLDLMSAIQVNSLTGLPDLVYSAHLVPSTAEKLETEAQSLPYEFLEPDIPSQLDANFLALINSLENEMARGRLTARSKQTNRDRVILVGVTTGYVSDAEESIAELEELALSADVVVLDKIVQRRPQIDPKTVLGRGKLEELLVRSMRLGADLIVFDTELSPSQVRSISEITDLKVIDRPQLILDIFAQRAQSREGKLQVELAQLKYLLPRLAQGQNSAFSRLAGGIGGRGPGETKLETDRRRVRDKISQLEKQVDNLGRQRQERRKNRVQKNLPIISLVGYTNAGKSTLLNTLTQSKVYTEKKMFATLDPTSRRLRLPYDQEVIINDTVGFIRDLPETLVAAFRATLEEISDSDLLVHVVDASNPNALAQIESVEKILGELNLNEIPEIVVLNKADLVEETTLAALERQITIDKNRETVAVSALAAKTLRPMVERIEATIGKAIAI
ncbi:MAG: GTPase HflX [Acidobacteria bacterium]|nr:GTPase HflX [Acidobacteriota bacterium]MBK8811766.1 GTPase HflX [Acidobacteriota bacterium]